MAYLGMHYPIEFSSNKAQGTEARVLYGYGIKDGLTIFALHIPVYIFVSFIWDLVASSSAKPDAAKNLLCFHLMSGLLLIVCFIWDVTALFKSGYWADLALWWDGVPSGHMSFCVKLYFLVQTTLLCCYLETLAYICYFGQDVRSMVDSVTDGSLNLFFNIICYALNFLPLLMVVVPLRFCIQIAMSLLQALSITEVSGKKRDFARVVLRAARWLTAGEVIFYAALTVANIVYGTHSTWTQMLIPATLIAMLGNGAYRFTQSNKYDLDLLRAGDAAAQGAPAAAPAAPPAKSKSKSRK